MATNSLTRNTRRYGPEYQVWASMLQRCNNPKDRHFHDYGGRGIVACEGWRSFQRFLSDMGRRPSPKHTLERVNNNDGYSPDNCRWATRKEQQNNRRTNRVIEFDGRRQTLQQWIEELGLQAKQTSWRLCHGWTPEQAFLLPLGFKPTHCPSGHEYSKTNKVKDRSSYRCRACHNEKERLRRLRLKDASL